MMIRRYTSLFLSDAWDFRKSRLAKKPLEPIPISSRDGSEASPRPSEDASHPTQREQEAETFWATQWCPSIPALTTKLATSSNSDTGAAGIVTHPLSVNCVEITREKLLCALSLVTAAYTSSEAVAFGIHLPSTSSVLPFRAIITMEDTVYKVLGEIAAIVSEAERQKNFGGRFVEKQKHPRESLSQLQTVLDLRSMPEEWRPSSNNTFESQADQEELSRARLVLKLDFRSKSKPFLTCRHHSGSVSRGQTQRLLWQINEILCQLRDSNQDRPVSSIGCLSLEELAQIGQWNASTSSAVSSCVHDSFRAWAVAQPSAEAISSWDRSLSYAELDDFSTRLAYYLLDHCHVTIEELVPLCIERSALALVAMLGVMKAGAAFVPLDPANPRARNEAIVEQSGAKIILTSQAGSFYPTRAVDFSWNLLDVLTTSSVRSLPSVSPDNLVYLIFTSGSTGRPKGVMIEHGCLSTSLQCHGDEIYDQNTSSRVLQFASLAFDASMTEHLAPLYNGACVFIPDQNTRMENIVDFINIHRINWAFFTPSFLKLIDPNEVPCLTTIVSGGEAITDDCIERWASKVKLINGYGPSETTIVATACVVDPSTKQRSSIGQGLACNTWIVDIENHKKLLPIGAVGELLIQGPIVGRGYLNDEIKTKAAFVSSPWWGRTCEKFKTVYKTGDLVRYDDNGSLLYMGRKDTQTKIRGQRLELSEVEYHISLVHGIKYAAAFAPKSGLHKGRLIAVFTLRVAESSTSQSDTIQLLQQSAAPRVGSITEEARALLTKKLPSYMVPEFWYAIKTMPITSSGKIDRTTVALWVNRTEHDMSRAHSNEQNAHPTTNKSVPANEIERIVQEAWARALNLPQHSVYLNCSFQSLGGDSITAMQVLSRCRSRNLHLGIGCILKGGSIAAIAADANLGQAQSWPEEELGRPFGLSPIQQMYVRHIPSSAHHFNQSLVLRLSRSFDTALLQQAIFATVERHSMLRSRLLRTEDGQFQQLITKNSDGSVIFTAHNVSSLEKVHEINEASQHVVNIEIGPIIAADMIDVSDGPQVLSLVAHHFAIDLVSWRIISEDLAAYLETGRLPAVRSMSFQSWCKDQSSYSRRNWSPAHVLPYSVPTETTAFWGMSEVQNTYGNVLKDSFRLGSGITANILKHCYTKFNIEPLDLFLAALFLGFAKCFPERGALTIHNEGHGREPWQAQQDISRTVGWFTTLCPIVAKVGPQDDIWSTVSRVHHMRKKVLNNGMPYFSSRFMNSEGIQAFDRDGPMEIVFNYMGVHQRVSKQKVLLEEMPGFQGESGDHASPNMKRFSIFEISAKVDAGSAEFTFVRPKDLLHGTSIHSWIEVCKSVLTLASVAMLDTYPLAIASCEMSQMTADYDTAMSILRHAKEGLPRAANIIMLCPTSSIQMAMLVSQASGSGCYCTRLGLSITSRWGNVDPRRIAAAWEKVVSYHAILRTVFVERFASFEWDQVLLKDIKPQIEHIRIDSSAMQDLLSLPLAQWSEAEPHHKLSICESAHGKITCLLECSHALIDHASLSIIYDDLSSAYAGLELPVSSVPYSTLTAHLQQNAQQASLSFWRDVFASNPSCRLTDVITTASATPVGGRYLRHITVPLVSSFSCDLEAFCRALSITPSVFFRLAWTVLLSRRLSSTDVGFGYVVAGRDLALPGIEQIVGPCLNIIACVQSIKLDSSVLQCLESVQTQFLRSLEHQVEFLEYATMDAEPNGGQAALPTTARFDTLLNFRRHTKPATGSLSADNEATLQFEVVAESDPFDYALVVEIDHRLSGELDVVLSYWSNDSSNTQVEELAAMYAQVLTGAVKASAEDKIGSFC